ncbi:hypothetical protein QUF74_01395 [Candidatus Halobeggiatoa sp. HSG11]|nr:hypothetical protein [Candidatus Halobeggiatoa sp. HSG11]
MIQNRLHCLFLLVILLLIHPVIMADDWKDLHNDLDKDLDKDFLEYVDKAKIDEATKKKHTELTERLCKIHEQGAKSNKVFEIMRYYDQFDPEPDIKLDLVLTKLWFDALKGWYISSKMLSDNLKLSLNDASWNFADELSNSYSIFYCDGLLKKLEKKYFNILNFRLLDKHDLITKYVSWLKKLEDTNKDLINAYNIDFSKDSGAVVYAYSNVLPNIFPDVWLNSLMEYADFQKKFNKTQKKLEQLITFYNNKKNSDPKALEYLRKLKNIRMSEHRKQDDTLRYYLFSRPVVYYTNYRYSQYSEATSLVWFDDKDAMHNAAIQLSKLTPFIPYLDEDTVKYVMKTQRIFKDKFGEKEYTDIVTESKLLPNNWANVFKKLTPP